MLPIIFVILVAPAFGQDDFQTCKCPMLKQIDADLYAEIRGTPDMPQDQIPEFAPLKINYGGNCTKVTIECNYPIFTRHRSSVYYANGKNLSTVRRHDLANKYSIRCNQQSGVWISDEESDIQYIQCAYRKMLINKVSSTVYSNLVDFLKLAQSTISAQFSFLKFLIGYD